MQIMIYDFFTYKRNSPDIDLSKSFLVKRNEILLPSESLEEDSDA
jgi:hypothetical protein